MENPAPRTKSELACDACRLLKVKCIKDAREDITCKKCTRSGACCTWTARPTPTHKNASTRSASRISALETKIDQLLAVIDEQSSRTNASRTGSRSIGENGVPDPSSADSASSVASSISLLVSLSERVGLTEDMAEVYLRRFHNMTLYFPFVIIPASMSVQTLAHQRPMLCLAILTTSTSQDPVLQNKLEEILRKDLVEKIMVAGEKTLDLLAALLVYLGWSHFYYVPKRDSMMQFMWLAISICEELGLSLTPEEASRREIRVRLDHYEANSRGAAEHDLYFCGEARRLYLGTYFLANCFSWAFAETSRLNDNEHVVACATSLAHENEHATDALILCLIRMLRLAQRYHTMFADSESFQAGVVQFNIQLDHLEETMSSIKASLPLILRHSALVDLTYHYALTYAYEADMINPLVRSRRLVNDSELTTSVVERCLKAIKGYFEAFFTIPASEYPFLSGYQWVALVYTITLLYKLSLGLPRLPSWNVHLARSMAPLDVYLDQCCKTMDFAHRIAGHEVSSQSSPRKDLYSLQVAIWRDVLEEYERRKSLLPEQRMSSSSGVVHRKALENAVDHGPKAGTAASARDTTANGRREAPNHPCPAYMYWK